MTDDFRALLRRYRDRRRWSQERLADESEMDHSLVSRLETGGREPTRGSIAKLCAGLTPDHQTTRQANFSWSGRLLTRRGGRRCPDDPTPASSS